VSHAERGSTLIPASVVSAVRLERSGVMQEINALKALLQARGLRITAPRLAVLQALDDGTGHRSAEEIYAHVLARYPVLDHVTVYRTLELFELHGLADRVTLGDKVLRWERRRTAHHHLFCQQCPQVVELDHAPFALLAATLADQYGIQAEVQHLALPGLCSHCAQHAKATSGKCEPAVPQ
jgi:Fe2+ or Zn2+ uptake regulation protein